MAPHCTDWKAPVSPRGLPLSTISASTRTSVKARPGAMTVNRPASKEGERAGQPREGGLDASAEGEPRRGGQRRGDPQVALAPPAEERHEVRQEAVHRLDEPGDGADEEEVGDLAGGEPALLQHDGQRLVRQVPHALGEVDDGEQDGEAGGGRRPEGGELPEARAHSRTMAWAARQAAVLRSAEGPVLV